MDEYDEIVHAGLAADQPGARLPYPTPNPNRIRAQGMRLFCRAHGSSAPDALAGIGAAALPPCKHICLLPASYRNAQCSRTARRM